MMAAATSVTTGLFSLACLFVVFPGLELLLLFVVDLLDDDLEELDDLDDLDDELFLEEDFDPPL
ncbi:NADH dehydrogenase subunit M [Paenibacillus alvei]|uniref:NADH dehydrogenase subunit M n=1 Tax=Paenibacillus alvei TaxID=44250 RepID=A0A383RD61_PAEAL|nr:NADH dehydrogenase subunit M [Paenibacillus alvei]